MRELELETVADGRCDDCQTSVLVQCADLLGEGDFRITVTTADGEKQRLRLRGEATVHLAKTLFAVMRSIEPGWDPES